MQITIIGAGEIGKTIEKVLTEKKEDAPEVFLWDKDSSKVAEMKPLNEIALKSEVIFLCIPSFAYAEVLEKYGMYFRDDAIIISLAKGILPTGETMAEAISKYVTDNNVGFLAGPMIAEEILAGNPAAAVLATEKEEVFKKIEKLFSESLIKIVWSRDIKGVLLASVLKNIYALMFGVCDGLDLGTNAKGVLFKKGISEMEKVIEYLGGNPESALSLAGIGDFFATATSVNSKNHSVGFKIGKEKIADFSGEGAISFNGLKVKLGEKILEFPMVSSVEGLLSNPEKSSEIINNILWN